MPDLDLNPHEWESEREKPREPFFGPGWPSALGWLIGFTISVSVTYFVLH